jgi:hypothetical protein
LTRAQRARRICALGWLTGGAPPAVSPGSMMASDPSSPAAPISNDRQEPGLWLWQGEAPSQGEALPQGEPLPQGEAPPPASPARPPSRVERIAYLAGSAVRRARWMGPSSGWFLVGLAAFVMAHALSGGEPIPGNGPAAVPQRLPPALAAVPQPGRSPSVALPANPAPPAGMTVAQLGQVLPPSGSVAPRMAERTEHLPAKRRASRRSRFVVRRAYPLLVYRWTPVFSEPCRYQCDGGAEVMTWHGGGY